MIVRDKSTHEEHLSQPLQTQNKQFEIAVTFLTGYNDIFNVTSSNNKFYFLKSITDEDGYMKNYYTTRFLRIRITGPRNQEDDF